MKEKKMRAVAVRFPEYLHEMITEYAEASQSRIATYCRFAVYEYIFNQIAGEISQLKMLKSALEKLDLTGEQLYEQKRAIKDLENRVSRFEPLMHELGAELYGKKENENA